MISIVFCCFFFVSSIFSAFILVIRSTESNSCWLRVLGTRHTARSGTIGVKSTAPCRLFALHFHFHRWPQSRNAFWWLHFLYAFFQMKSIRNEPNASFVFYSVIRSAYPFFVVSLSSVIELELSYFGCFILVHSICVCCCVFFVSFNSQHILWFQYRQQKRCMYRMRVFCRCHCRHIILKT